MAASGTPTTNLGLRIPLGTDAASVADINYNSNVQDQKIGAVGNTSLQAQVDACADGLAIVSNGNTHGAITSGQFVYVKNHSTLAEGLYVASANISANATLSTSNLTADNNGGMNTLLGEINKQLPLIGSYTPEFSWGSGATPVPVVDNASFRYMRVGHLLFVNGRFTITTLNAPSALTYLAMTIPTGFNSSGSIGNAISGWLISNSETYKPFLIRGTTGNKIIIAYKASGANSSNQLSEDTYNLFAFVPLSSAN